MRISAVLFLLISITAVHAADTWPQWRGPNRDCHLQTKQWPGSLQQDSLQQVHRIPLGSSYSGPIVIQDRVFVTETVDGKEAARAFDLKTGEEVWKTDWEAGMKVPFFAASNGSWIRSTPAYADGRLFVASMEDVLLCLQATDGKLLWKMDFRKEFGTENQSFGFVCSPLVDGSAVIVQTAAGLVSLNCETGAVNWRGLTESGGMMGGAFSSPVIATVAETRQLIVQTRQKLCGVRLEDGQELWSFEIPAFRGMNILTPTVVGDRIFTSSYGGGSTMLEVTGQDGKFDVAKLWQTKVEAYMSSPLVVDGYLYLHLRNQRATCLNPADGTTQWTSTPFGKYWSVVANGTQALVLDERGDLLLLDLNNREFSQVDARHVSDSPTWAHLAMVDNQIFVRDLEGLTVYAWGSR
jgi:outer membrane protein assembly factor BamB